MCTIGASLHAAGDQPGAGAGKQGARRAGAGGQRHAGLGRGEGRAARPETRLAPPRDWRRGAIP